MNVYAYSDGRPNEVQRNMNFLSTGQVTKMGINHDMEEVDASNIKIEILDDVSPIPPNKSAFVDKITMEYMMNRNHYKKYLAKTNTILYKEVQEKMTNVRACSDDIKEIVDTLLEDFVAHGSFTKYNTDVIQSFEEFMTICMRYIKENPKDDSDECFSKEDTDVLFGSIQSNVKNSRKIRGRM